MSTFKIFDRINQWISLPLKFVYREYKYILQSRC